MKATVLNILVLFVVVLAASPVLAQGFYAGAGIGNTFFSSEFEDATDQITEIDENSTAWKIFGGFRSDRFFGVEGGYRDFGTVDSKVGDIDIESGFSGWDIEALGRFEIAIFDIFAKAGFMFWSADAKVEDHSEDDSGTDFFWGLGAGVHFGAIGVRLEWESLEVGGPDNLSMVSLSGTLGF